MRWQLSVAAALPLAVLAVIGVRSNRPQALWLITHDLCTRNMQAYGRAFPCETVNLPGGYAIIRDWTKPTQLLVVPTKRLTGIESPELLKKGAPGYWQAAWQARHLIEHKLGRPIPREDVALAINSKYGRTQEQLHIHVDCVRYDVLQALKRHENEIGAVWSDLDFHIIHRGFRAMRLEETGLIGQYDPFKQLAYGDSRARADMGRETLAVIGATFSDGTDGFYLLSDRADPMYYDRGLGEELLDPRCRVLNASG